MDDILLTEVADGVAIVTLNRPRQMNALSSALRRRLGEALAAVTAVNGFAIKGGLGGTLRAARSSRTERMRVAGRSV